MAFGDDDGESLLRFLDLEFNRVEGVHLGLKADTEDLIEPVSLRGAFAYGFSDKLTKYSVGVTVDVTEALSLGADYYRNLGLISDQGYYGKEFNSLTALLVKNDYRDYYVNEGWTAFISVRPKSWLSMKISVVDEEHSAAEVATDFSLFNTSAPSRSRLTSSLKIHSSSRLRQPMTTDGSMASERCTFRQSDRGFLPPRGSESDSLRDFRPTDRRGSGSSRWSRLQAATGLSAL
jgi:hypothetical protein